MPKENPMLTHRVRRLAALGGDFLAGLLMLGVVVAMMAALVLLDPSTAPN